MDPLGNATTYTYFSNGDLHTKVTPGSTGGTDTATYAYDTAGDRTGMTDALAVADPSGHHTTTYAYDGAGRLTDVTDPLGHTTHTVYDADSRVLSQSIYPSSTETDTTKYTYDAEGNRISVTNARGYTTYYTYDAKDELCAVTDPLAGATSPPTACPSPGTAHTTVYAYDADGNRTALTDPNGHTTTYTFDLMNWLTAVTYPKISTDANSPYSVHYGYDGAGNRITTTNARGQTITYTYDEANRQEGISYPDGSSVAYTYYANGQRHTMTDSTGTTTYTYDADGHVLSIVQPNGAISYTYDPAGNRQTMTVPGPKTTTYAYDAANRLTTVSDWHSGVTTYTYDTAGRVIAAAYANGDSAAYAYDNANRTTSITYSHGSSTLASFAYTYDADGNRLSETDGSGTVSCQGASVTTCYGYDALDRLTSVQTGAGTMSYVYDAAGNRTKLTTPSGTTTYTYNEDDQLTSAGSTTYTYDADGNRITATTGGTTFTYGYDATDHLTGITGGAQAIGYGYDGDHNRVAISVGSTTTAQVLDLAASLPEVAQQTTGSTTTTYLYGNGLLAQDAGSGEQFLLHDGLGSVRTVASSSGTSAGSASYDAYGSQSASGAISAFGFNGQQMDAAGGLIYLRARYYDPATGVFLSRDPLRGDTGPYEYAGDNPVNDTDPTGLCSWSPSDNDSCFGGIATTVKQDAAEAVNGLTRPKGFSIDAGAYAGLGGEGRVTFTGGGWSVCGGLGVGFGGSVTASTASKPDMTGEYVDVSASAGAGHGAFGAEWRGEESDSSPCESFSTTVSAGASAGVFSASLSHDLGSRDYDVSVSAGTPVEVKGAVGYCYEFAW